MKQQILYFILLISLGCLGQNNCTCPKTTFFESTKTLPDTVFIFSNNKKIMLCGYKEKIKGETFFSEFILQVCGKELEIDFWDATQTCQLNMENDTLTITEIKNLPTGINRSYKNTVWSTTKIYFKGETINSSFSLNRAIKKYSKEEIKESINEFRKANGKMDDYKMTIANRLFISILSGSKTAKECFIKFTRKFGPLDGAHAEEYNDLGNLIYQWEL